MTRKRKGMIIKNTDTEAMSGELEPRVLHLPPGGSGPITSEEVMDPSLRDLLQTRQLAIVRPITPAEEIVVRGELAGVENPGRS